jgi:hypothetical protein
MISEPRSSVPTASTELRSPPADEDRRGAQLRGAYRTVTAPLPDGNDERCSLCDAKRLLLRERIWLFAAG